MDWGNEDPMHKVRTGVSKGEIIGRSNRQNNRKRVRNVEARKKDAKEKVSNKA